MEPSAQGTRNGLCFEMVIKSCSITPYFIPPDLDQSGTEHKAEDQPTKQNDDWYGCLPPGKWTHVNHWTKKDSEKPSLTELDLPAISIPFLSYMNKGHVKEPENSKQRCIRKARYYYAGKQESDPGDS